jgi:hypothetical protein
MYCPIFILFDLHHWGGKQHCGICDHNFFKLNQRMSRVLNLYDMDMEDYDIGARLIRLCCATTQAPHRMINATISANYFFICEQWMETWAYRMTASVQERHPLLLASTLVPN